MVPPKTESKNGGAQSHPTETKERVVSQTGPSTWPWVTTVITQWWPGLFASLWMASWRAGEAANAASRRYSKTDRPTTTRKGRPPRWTAVRILRIVAIIVVCRVVSTANYLALRNQTIIPAINLPVR